MSTLPLAMIGWQEALPILLILLVLFGGRKLPELARAMGTSITQFKKGLKEDGEDKPKIDGGDQPKIKGGGGDDGGDSSAGGPDEHEG
jgi:sec-independent protein translocase protein TatA